MLIAIEGPDGCGKTTQVEMFRQYAERNDLTRAIRVDSAISKSPIGRFIRKALAGEEKVNALEMQALMTADRLARARAFEQHVNASGTLVVVDRWTMSAFVYGTLDIEREALSGQHPEFDRLHDFSSQSSHVKWLRRINREVPRVDLTIVVGVSYDRLRARLATRERKDVYEHDSFVRDVVARYGYVQRHYGQFLEEDPTKANATNVHVIDGELSAEDVHAQICSKLADLGVNPWKLRKGK